MSKRAVLYARISGDDRKNATSGVDGQLEDCRKYATEKGYLIVEEFFEERNKYTSGADWLPELNKIIQLASKNKFDVLIVRELDRLARNRFKQISVENELDRFGVRVEYANGRYEDTAEGRLLKGLMADFAEFEREKIEERTTRGIIKSVESGNVMIGGSYAPYGYIVVTENGKRQLIIDEYEVTIILLIFRLYAIEGYTIHALVDYLNEQKIPKPCKGNNHKAITRDKNPLGWSEGTIRGILTNETYIGRWYYRKTKSCKNPKTGKRQNVSRPKEEWLMVEVPAIIDEKLFDLVQLRRDENKRVIGKQRKNFYMLGGMMTCGHCGNHMSGSTNQNKSGPQGFYKCAAVHTPKRFGFKCDNPIFKTDEVDTVVWGWVKSILLSPDLLQRGFELYEQRQLTKHQPIIDMIEANETKLETIEKEKERLIKAYSAGILTLDEIAVQKTALDKQIADLTQAIASLRADLNPNLLSPATIETIETWAEKIRRGQT